MQKDKKITLEEPLEEFASLGEYPEQSCEVPPGSFMDRLQLSSEFPLTAMICVTERCMMSCAHCYQSEKSGRDELSTKEIDCLLDQLVDMGVFRLVITGGEPTLRTDLDQIVRDAWKRRFAISIKTTAYHLNEDRVRELRENGLSTLSVSLYHSVPELHDSFVGMKDAWKRAVAAMTLFRELGGIVFVNMIAMGWNADSVASLKKMAHERGWSFLADMKVMHAYDGSDRAKESGVEETAFDTVMRVFPESSIPGQSPTPDRRICSAGTSLVYIKPNGDVWTCPVLPLSLGNIREKPLKQIWLNSTFRQEITHLKWSDSEKCANCDLSAFCRRCPGEAYLEHGDMRKETTIDCQLAKVHSRLWNERSKR